jgi:GT2 family glycosyltransferase
MRSLRKDWYDAENPDVSIVIQTFNASELTKKCLSALSANTFGYRYEIIIVDNGSNGSAPEHVQALAAVDYRMVYLQAEFNFGEGCNAGAQQAKGEYLVFLNNDVSVNFGWLNPLIETLNGYPDAGAAGARALHPDGGLQEAGAFVDSDGFSIQVGTDKPYHPEEETKIRIVDYCSAACLAIPKALFSRLGGFDPIFRPAYYEDADLCLRIAGAGKRVYCCPQSTVVHIKNSTARIVWSAEELKAVVESNRQRFLRRWGPWLRARGSGHAAPVPLPFRNDGNG